MKPLVTVSKLATRHLVNLLKTNKTNQVLFAVEGGGCNGMKYLLDPIKNDQQLEATDVVTFYQDPETENKYQINVCQKSQLYLLGTHIDWSDDFMGQKFTFLNPNQASSCGCGNTFSI